MNRHSFFSPFIIAVIVLSVVFISCNRQEGGGSGQKGDNMTGKITVSGAFALYPMAVRWAEEFKKLHPKVVINISAGGAGKGMADALSHMVDLGMYSKEVSPEERAKGAWYIGVAKDAVLPTVNSGNPVLKELRAQGLTKQKFADIFINGTITTWGAAVNNGSKATLQPFTRSDACGAAEMWAKYMAGKKQEDLIGLGVNGDPGVADAIRKTVGGIGYNNLNFVFDMTSRKVYPGIAIVPIDLNGNGRIDPEENFYGTLDQVMNAIQTGIYPSPPARDLYLVAAGKPTNKAVLAFLHWILTDGQKFLNEAGYVALSGEKIQTSLSKLN
jgi:phosphate transport system substrate-binding protein